MCLAYPPGGDISIANLACFGEAGYQGDHVASPAPPIHEPCRRLFSVRCNARLRDRGAGGARPRLHAAEYVVANEFHDHDHGHSHDWDVEDNIGDPQVDHHHADHSHEKAGLSPVMGISRISDTIDTRVPLYARLVGEPPFLIERPPRTMA
jgi:hypothetical protein